MHGDTMPHMSSRLISARQSRCGACAGAAVKHDTNLLQAAAMQLRDNMDWLAADEQVAAAQLPPAAPPGAAPPPPLPPAATCPLPAAAPSPQPATTPQAAAGPPPAPAASEPASPLKPPVRAESDSSADCMAVAPVRKRRRGLTAGLGDSDSSGEEWGPAPEPAAKLPRTTPEPASPRFPKHCGDSTAANVGRVAQPLAQAAGRGRQVRRSRVPGGTGRGGLREPARVQDDPKVRAVVGASLDVVPLFRDSRQVRASWSRSQASPPCACA